MTQNRFTFNPTSPCKTTLCKACSIWADCFRKFHGKLPTYDEYYELVKIVNGTKKDS